MRELDLLSEQSIEVIEVLPGSPAVSAGIQQGDWIVSAGGRIVSGTDDLHRILTVWPTDQDMPMELVRDDRKIEITVTLR